MKIVDSLRDDILAGKLKSGNEIKVVRFLLFLQMCFFIFWNHLRTLMKIWLCLGSVEEERS